jgi:hypothetical protein
MKRIVTLCVSVIFGVMLLPSPMSASHIAALDLSLTCLGGNDYKVRFVLYRDCSGITAPATVHLTFTCSGNPAYNFTLSQVPPIIGTGQTITPSCPAMPTRCNGGTMYGVQEYVFEAQVTLPLCNQWRVSWSTCCRNPSNTISSATSASAYIEATLNNLDAPCNSNPVFASLPLTTLVVGQTTMINHGAIDPDGDSLVYTLVTPFNSSNTTYVNWLPPYTANQPFPSIPAMILDPVTGILTVTPTMNIISPMAIRVEEWRTINGVPVCIGTIYRDLQINAIASINSLPVLGGMSSSMGGGYNPNDTMYNTVVCLGDAAEFFIHGFDADVFNPLVPGNAEKFTITWNGAIPAASFQVFNQGSDSAFAHFYWKPNAAHLAIPTHCFTVTIQDQACPYHGQNTFTYCITVQNPLMDLGPDTLICRGESVWLTPAMLPGITEYQWTVNGQLKGESPQYKFSTKRLQQGIYTIKAYADTMITGSFCTYSGQIKVQVVQTPEPDLGNDTTLTYKHWLILDAGPGYQYLWSTGETSRKIGVNTTGFYWVVVDGGNGTRCTGSDSIYVHYLIGLDDPNPNCMINLWPNPSSGLLTLHLAEPCKPGTSLSVFNAAGECVLEPTPINPGVVQTTLRLNHLPDGVYLLRISSQQYTTNRKVVLTRL